MQPAGGFFVLRQDNKPHRAIRTYFGHFSSSNPQKPAGVAVNAAQANPIHAQGERPGAEDPAQAARTARN
jgi:hypothetical protein